MTNTQIKSSIKATLTSDELDFINSLKEGTSPNAFQAPEVEYEAKTIDDLIENIVNRIDETIDAFTAYTRPSSIKDNPLVSPMAKARRIGYFVKIGLGKKNEAIHETLQFHANTTEQAIEKLERFKTSFETRKFDRLLEIKLESFRERAEKGKEAKKKRAEERKNARADLSIVA